MPLAANPAWNSGPHQPHVQISELGVGWEPGGPARAEGPGPPALDPLSVPLASSHQPLGLSY